VSEPLLTPSEADLVDAHLGRDDQAGAEQPGTVEEFAAAKVELPFAWASELRDATPPEPEWVVDGYLAEGSVMLLAGRPKWAGKSTLAWAMAEAVAGEVSSFLGRVCGRRQSSTSARRARARSRTS
jgi:hypothetical protein